MQLPCRLRGAMATTLLVAISLPVLRAQSPADTPRGIVQSVEFIGLRRLRPDSLRAHITSAAGQPLDPKRVESDVRALARLGWFDWVTAEVLPPDPSQGTEETGVQLLFRVDERPFLTGVEFRGSRALPRERITSLLGEKGIALTPAAPLRGEEVACATHAVESALAGLGYSQAQVRVRVEPMAAAAVRVKFEIADGPKIAVSRVAFSGNSAFAVQTLRRQMKRVAPGAAFAALRGKDVYTAERLAQDLDRLQEFYRNHGYPEARIGRPQVTLARESVRHWFPWPHSRAVPRFHITVPVEEGRLYRLTATEVARETGAPLIAPAETRRVLRALRPGLPYSQQKVEQARQALARLPALRAAKSGAGVAEVDAYPQFDPDQDNVRVVFRVRMPQPYIVRKLEFLGARRFSDRYYRRRILLKEGEPFDPRKLELGLAQLARAGFVRPAKPQDIRVKLDDARHTADVTIRVEEIGRQRISFVGGHAGLGSTIGLVYNVFDLLGGEEMITAHLEGGPESLQVLLGIAKEGVFGTRASLGFTLFQNVLRPYLPGGPASQRLFASHSSGLALGGTYPITPRDTLGLSYQISNAATRYDLNLPPGVSGVPTPSLQNRTRSRSIALREFRDLGSERLDASASVSGGWLGGTENLLRSSVEYARLEPDAFSSGRNAWAFRGYIAGVSSYRGDLPLSARLFAGNELVRGFRTGELGPYAAVESFNSQSTPIFRAQATGADLVSGVNAEYRVPLAPRTEAVAFFDAGSGWLLPGWLGADRPSLLSGTNGVLRASTGLELKWRLPAIEQPIRLHYALNPIRLARALGLPDGGIFRPPDRRAAFGWALGAIF